MTTQTPHQPKFRALYVPASRPVDDLLPRAKNLVGEIDRVLTAPDRIDLSWFREYPRLLKAEGFSIVDLVTLGEWLGDGKPPDAARVSDHVACRLPNPLTGSLEAAGGQAFLDMRGAYLPGRHEEIPHVVVWHTTRTSGLSEQEKNMAISAGCNAACPFVAPWAVGVVAAGMRFSALLLF
jgi:hypothetical protein